MTDDEIYAKAEQIADKKAKEMADGTGLVWSNEYKQALIDLAKQEGMREAMEKFKDTFEFKKYQEDLENAKAEGKRLGLEDFIREMFGERCGENEERCPCCEMWKLYDEYIEEMKKGD